MKRRLVMSLASAAFLVTSPATRAEEKKAAEAVEVTGCVERSVTPDCLVLKDPKQGVFTLLVPAKLGKPEPRMAIRAKGTLSGKVTTCNQGKPIDVTEWEQLRMPCPEGEQAK